MANKRYLTGTDWLMQALDFQAKESGLPGNYSQIVLETDCIDDVALLKTKLFEFLRKNPILSGACARDLNLCPYWALNKNKIVLNFTHDDVSDDVRAREQLNNTLNIALPQGSYLAFYLINSEARSFFAMKFDHRLFDARGAEMFLNSFSQFCIDGKLPENQLFLPAGLNKWGEKFSAGRTVNRFLLSLQGGQPPLTLNGKRTNGRVKFYTMNFSAFEFKSIEGKSEEVAGHMMFMPYLLAISARVYRAVFFPAKESDIVVPVNLDTREKGNKEVFFNHVSFLFFRILHKELEDMKTLVGVLSQNWFDQVKRGIPKAIDNASMLMRILPVSSLAGLAKTWMGGELAAFAFSCINESGYESKDLMGKKVHNIFHLPIVPPSPGLGIFFTQYNGGLNLTISYLEGKATTEQVEQLADLIRDELF